MNAQLFNGGGSIVKYRVVISLAAATLLAWTGIAQAQQPKPRPLETALVGPGTLVIPGIGSVEGVLSTADAARYKRVFELQETGDWKSANAIVARIQDRRLMGHVEAQRYLHPTKYRSRFTELRAWMAAHADHPQARRIHRLAVLRQPSGVRAAAAPITNTLAIRGEAVRKASEGRPLYSRASTREGRDLQSDMRRRVARGWPTGAKQLLEQRATQRRLNNIQIAQAWRDIARGYFRAGKDETALSAAWAADVIAPGAAPLAYWWGGLAAWRLGKTQDAETLFSTLAQSTPAADSLVSAGGFWAARAALTNGHPDRVTVFLEIGAVHERHFYGLLSRRALGVTADFGWKKPDLHFGDFRDIADTRIGGRAIALLQVGQEHEAERELLNLAAAQSALLPDVLALAAHANLPAVSLKLSGFAEQQAKLATAYPVPDWAPADGYAVDKALVFAFVRQESAFNRRAKSHAGARGLMQLMPRTASYVARESALRGRGKYKLFDPEFNLALGQQYIELLMSERGIQNDLFRTATAYNAGPGNLRKWERNVPHGNDPLLFIESLPSRETRAFVERILTNLWIYRDRLGQNSPSLDDIVAGRWPRYEAQDTNGTD
ncbi:MAG: lytic transglycosylase domain-containing protein [Rhodospirillaceae bacterium]|nr:lytic transglycosylase domain-containing protein [Rhodospirillaceae bacterium]MBT7362718.1 lytic transglycosylase domain-containing protein [Rhodospirillaceae bacterium]